MYAAVRILIGSVLLVSGVEKAVSPYQNFLYVIQAYALLPGWGQELTARVLPWLELFAGLFLVLGLWVRAALSAGAALFGTFVLVVGQAMLRGLPLDNCGCFGQMLHVPPRLIIVFDSFCILLVLQLLRRLPRTRQFSIDKFFEK